MQTEAPTLRVHDLFAGYQQGIDILRGLTLATAPAGVTVVLGPNGAGKSTLLKTIFGLVDSHTGSVTFDGRDVTNLPPATLKRMGVSYVPQGTNMFPQMTIEENLRMGGWTLRHDKARLKRQIEQVYELFPMLSERRRVKATQLSGGQARQLSLAKEVLTSPKILLVDEPTAGLAPNLTQQVYEFLLRARKMFNASILLVDQNVSESVAIADQVFLIDRGRVHASGPREDFTDEKVAAMMRELLVG